MPSRGHRPMGGGGTWAGLVLWVAALLHMPLHGELFEFPTLLAVYPDVGPHVGGTYVTVSGRGFFYMSDISYHCLFDLTPVPATVLSTDMVTCTSPPHQPGFVKVDFAIDNATSDVRRLDVEFEYTAGALLDDVYPLMGGAGTVVWIYGSNFVQGLSCRFGDLIVRGAFHSTVLASCIAPPRAEGFVPVEVANNGVEFTAQNLQFTYLPVASVTAQLDPASGPEYGGTVVVVTGVNFVSNGVFRCRFRGGVEVGGTWHSSNMIQCHTPASPPGPAVVEVSQFMGRDFTASGRVFRFTPMVRLQHTLPPQVTAPGGTSLTLKGIALGPSVAPACKFDLQVAPGRAGSDAQTALCPHVPAAAPGFGSVYLSKNGADFEGGLVMEYKQPMSLHSVAPKCGGTAGGALVTVTGAHFLFESIACRFGRVRSPAHVVSSGYIVCEAPPHLEGLVMLDVEANGLGGSDATMLPDMLYDTEPEVRKVDPAKGPAAGGTMVTVTMTPLPDCALWCRFGTLAPVAVEWVSETEVRCEAPAHAPGRVPFDVAMAGGGAVGGHHYTYALPAAIDAIITNADGTVTIHGSGFEAGTSVHCSFDAGRAVTTGTVQSDTTVLCAAPHGAADFSTVTLEELDGTFIAAGGAETRYVNPLTPEILSVFPSSGPAAGGTQVTLSGRHFQWGFADPPLGACRFGSGPPQPAHFLSTTQIVCEAGAHPPGRAVVSASNNGREWAQSGVVFAFEPQVTVGLVAPARGPEVGGTTLQVAGGGLLNSDALVCRAGTFSHLPARWHSASRAACTSPAHAPGRVPMALCPNFKDCAWAPEAAFNFAAPLRPAALAPAAGPVRGGARVTVHGASFPGTHKVMCRFGAAHAVLAAAHAAAAVQCVAPAHAAGFASVEISSNGRDWTAGGVQYEYALWPAIWEVSPPHGPAPGGTLLVLTGEHFAREGLTCVFDGHVAAPAEVQSSVVARCEAPARREAGAASLELSSGGAEAAEAGQRQFRFVDPPRVEASYPDEGVEDGGAAIYVYGHFMSEADTLACRVGTLGPLKGERLAADVVQCVPPAHAPGRVPVEVSINAWDFTAAESAYVYARSHDLAHIAPAAGPSCGGTVVTITGDRAFTSTQLACTWDHSPSEATRVSATQVVCASPPRPAGFAAVSVQNHMSWVLTNPIVFEFRPPAELHELQPRAGIEDGGRPVAVTGEHLLGPGLLCRFGAAPPTGAHSVSSALVLCEAPAHPEGLAGVELSVGHEWMSCGDEGRLSFEYRVAPHVAAVQPHEGPQGGGTVVRLKGQGFVQTDDLSCKFGTLGPIQARWVTASIVECVVPAARAGQVPLEAAQGGGQFTWDEVAYKYLDPSMIDAVFPDITFGRGADLIRIHGTRFLMFSNIMCRFGAEVVAGAWETEGVVLCRNPPQPSSFVGVEVATGENFKYTESGHVFTYVPNLSLQWIFPVAGIHRGATIVKIRADHFSPRVTHCVFDGLHTEATVIDPYMVSCPTPPHDPGEVPFGVALDGGSYQELGKFTYYYEPVITMVTPAQGTSDGGTMVTLTGANFTNWDTFRCKWGTISSIVGTFIDDSQVACKTPAHGFVGGTNGPLTDGTESIVGVYVTLNHFDYTDGHASALFEYIPAPGSTQSLSDALGLSGATKIWKLSHHCGPVLGGTVIRVYGAQFNPSSLSCKFGVDQAPATWVSFFEILCPSPPTEAGFTLFELITVAGITEFGNQFEFYARPAVTNVIPTQAAMDGSTVAHVDGYNFIRRCAESASDGTNRCSHCRLGTAKPYCAEFVSTALVKCELPEFESNAVLALEVSNNDQDYTNNQNLVTVQELPVITGVFPTFAPEGGGTLVTVYGRGFDEFTNFVCNFGTVVSVPAMYRSDTEQHCISPSHKAATLPLRVSMNDHDYGVFGATFVFRPHIELTAIAPHSGPVSGGTHVTIVGEHLGVQEAPQCLVDQAAVESYSVDHRTVVCVMPAHAPGFVTLEVQDYRLEYDYKGGVQFLFQVRHEVLSVLPDTGPEEGGGLVHLAGSHLLPGGTLGDGLFCRFGSSPESTGHAHSSAVVACEVPAHPEGLVEVEARAGGAVGQYSSSGITFQYQPGPVATAVDPSSGPAEGGVVVTVRGAMLLQSEHLQCRFGTTSVAALWVSSGAVECVAPAHRPGLVPLEVVVGGVSMAAAEPVSFEFQAPPRGEVIWPASGASCGGTHVRVHGAGVGSPGALSCRFGAVMSLGVYVSGSEVTCHAPVHPPGFVGVEVVAADGNTADAANHGVLFQFYAAPAVQLLQPPKGRGGGAAVIALVGENLIGPRLYCLVGAAPPSLGHFVSSRLVLCEAPAHPEGLAEVEVTASEHARPECEPSGLSYDFLLDPHAAAVEPSSGPAEGGGDVATAHGAGFSQAEGLACKFGSIHVAARWVSERAVECVPPAHAPGRVPVEVGYGGGDFSSGETAYEFLRSAAATAVAPTSGAACGGTALVVSAAGVGTSPADGALLCRVGAETSAATLLRAGEVACVAPAHPPGVVSVDVGHAGGGFGFESTGVIFHYYVAPAVQSVLPPFGPMGGAAVVALVGENLIGPRLYCLVGAAPPSLGHFVSSRLVLCEAPAHPEGLAEVEVTASELATPECEGSGVSYEYLPDLTVGGVEPAQGTAESGDAVAVLGAGFAQHDTLSCRFGTVAVAARWVSGGKVECVPPAHAPGRVPVEVGYGGPGFTSNEVAYNFLPPPGTDFIAPESGAVCGGAAVTVYGTEFVSPLDGRLMCRFGEEITPGRYLTDSQALCYAPAHAAGFVSVEVAHAELTSGFENTGVLFEYRVVPLIDNVLPRVGIVDGGTVTSVLGEHLVGVHGLHCMFGSAPAATAHFVSSKVVKCESAGHDEGLAAVEVSAALGVPECDDSGVVLEYIQAAVVGGVELNMGPHEGGEIVRVLGTSFSPVDPLVCKFGTVQVNAKWITDGLVECVSPAHQARLVPLEVGMGGADYTANEVVYEFLRQPVTEIVQPVSGAVCGGAHVTVIGTGFSKNGDTMCRFGVEVNAGTYVDQSHVLCRSPPMASGIVSVEVSNTENTMGFDHTGVLFEYRAVAIIDNVLPRVGIVDGGTVTSVLGEHLVGVHGLHCMFGSAPAATAHFVSSKVVKCESAGHDEGLAAVEVSAALGVPECDDSGVVLEYIQAPIVSGIDLNTGPHEGGEIVQVIGSGFSNVDTMFCKFGTVQVNAKWITDGLVECVSPAHQARLVPLEVGMGGADYTANEVVYEFLRQPVTEIVQPVSGAVCGGAQVTVIGTGFSKNGDTMCRFGVEVNAGTYVDQSHVLCRSPPMASGIVSVEVSNTENTMGFDHTGVLFEYYSQPTALMAHPPFSPDEWGTIIKVVGDNLILREGLFCRFGSAPAASAHFVSSRLLSCEAPAHPEGATALEVSAAHSAAPECEDSGLTFEFTLAPRVAGIVPQEGGVAGGDVVTAVGVGFSMTGALSCRFGSVAVAARWVSDSAVECVTPAHVPRTVPLEVGQGMLSYTGDEVTFDFLADATTTLAQPSEGAVCGGTSVTVYGAGFGGHAAPPPMCRFGDAAALAARDSSGVARCDAPAHPLGFTSVAVVRSGVSVGSPSPPQGVHFEFYSPPSGVALMPPHGWSRGGGHVMVAAREVPPAASQLFCLIGSAPPVAGHRVSSSLARCEVPAHNEGLAGVELTRAWDARPECHPSGLAFEYLQVPRVSAVQEAEGQQEGGEVVRVLGTGLDPPDHLRCHFGTVQAAARGVSGNELECVAPAHAPGPVALDLGDGSDRAGGDEVGYEFLRPPLAVGVRPQHGPMCGGTQVTVMGTGLSPARDTYCLFGPGGAVRGAYLDGGGIACHAPPAAAQFVAVELAGTSRMSGALVPSPALFQYRVAARAALVQPASGVASGGEVATVLGGDFLGVHPLHCLFGSAPAGRAHFVSSALVVCEVPSHPEGLAGVEITAAEGAGPECHESGVTFEYLTGLELGGVQPADGEVMGGTVVTASGLGFVERDAMFCRFGAVVAAARWISDGAVECVTPAHAPGAVPFEVGQGGRAFTRAEVAYFYRAPAEVAHVVPEGGATCGGARVTVYGARFSGDRAVTCRFGEAFVEGHYVTQGAVVCAAPQHAPAVVAVEVTTTGSSLDAPMGHPSHVTFAYYVAPSIEGVAPPHAFWSGGAVVWVSGSNMVAARRPLFCAVGAAGASLAHVVSSRLVLCEAPAHPEGLAGVEVSSDGGNPECLAQDSGAVLEYIASPLAAAVEPPQGHASGGEVVEVAGTGYEQISGLAVRFGTVWVAARWVTSDKLEAFAPSHRPGEVPVEAGYGWGEFTTSEVRYEFLPMPVTSAVAPASAPVCGGTQVTVTGAHFAMGLGTTTCRFGAALVPGTPLSASAVVCPVPRHPAGLVTVEVANVDDQMVYGNAGVSFEFRVVPMMELAQPHDGTTGGGDVIFLVTRDAVSEGSMFCLFGSSPPVSAHVVSPALLACEAPAHSEGLAGVEITAAEHAAPECQPRGLTFEYLAPGRVAGAEPSEGPAEGGMVTRVFGDGIPNTGALRCRFGTVHVAARWLGEQGVECITPTHRPGPVPVEIGQTDTYSSSGEVQYWFVSPPRVVTVLPELGYVSGGDNVEVVVSGWRWKQTDVVFCRFGLAVHQAVYVQSDAIVCALPPAATGFAMVTISTTWIDFAEGGAVFEYVVAPSVTDVQPVSSSNLGGALVTVSGSNFRSDMGCYVDGYPSGAVNFVSSTEFVCELPGSSANTWTYDQSSDSGGGAASPSAGRRLLQTGGGAGAGTSGGASDFVVGATTSSSVQVGVGFTGFVNAGAGLFGGGAASGRFSGVPLAAGIAGSAGAAPGAQVNQFSLPTVAAITPVAGPEAGGTIVTVSGSGFFNAETIVCKFGSAMAVATVLSDSVATCEAPAHNPGPVPFDIIVNGKEPTSSGLEYTYQAQPHVSAVIPSSGIDMGRTPVFIAGVNFVNSTGLMCRFGLKIVKAVYLSPSSMLCITPDQPTGSVFLEVTNNDLDYTTDRVIFHYSPCPPGHYCPDGNVLPCPRGAFCPGPQNFNFTLCPPGTYQPHSGHAECVPAPVGFFAPDFGMRVPRVCPRGAVCDVIGISSATKPCPPGHYCLSGTRTANFTSFTIPERPLPCPFGYFCGPGVTTNLTIVNNFTTPQACYPGYFCEPGSITPQGSGPCPSGHYCPPGEMIPCPPRTYCPNVANTEPKPCIPGLFNEEYGQSTCKQCPKGTICPSFFSKLPELCPAGSVCDEEGLPLPKSRCPMGHFCLKNTVTLNPLASLDEEQLLRSSPIPLDPFSFRPLPCLPGTYCTEGVLSNTTVEGNFLFPQPCKEGSFCEWSSSDSTEEVEISLRTDVSNPMLKCPPGNYCPKGTYIPIPSPRGSFASRTGNAQSALCLPGTYSPGEGFEECLSCPAGYQAPDDGTFKPTICGAGLYRSTRDSITCRNCPLGTWSNLRGLTDEALCTPCNPGTVCNTEGNKNNKPFGDNIPQALNHFLRACEGPLGDDDPACEKVILQPLGRAFLCPEGYVCDARTSTAAELCPDGYVCGFGTYPETQLVNKCPAGYFCPEGSAASTQTQFPCQSCFFCPEGTGKIQKRCPEGTQSGAQAFEIENCLADGITFWRVQPLLTELLDVIKAGTSLTPEDDDENQARRRMRRLLETDLARSERLRAEEAARRREEEHARMQMEAALGKMRENIAERNARHRRNAQRRRRLLQADGNETDPDFFEDVFTCDTTVDDLMSLTPEVIMELQADQQTMRVDEDGKYIPAVDDTVSALWMTKFKLNRNEIVKLKFDFRDISENLRYGEQYEIAIFMGEEQVDKTLCNVGTDEHKLVPCPPYDIGDGFDIKKMGVVPGREREDKCPASTAALELPFWFSRKQGNDEASNVFVPKRGIMDLQLLAIDNVDLRVEVRMLHGQYQLQGKETFKNTMCIERLRPLRGNHVPGKAFNLIMPRNDDVQLPLNVPRGEDINRSVRDGYVLCIAGQDLPACREYSSKVVIAWNSSAASESVSFEASIQGEARRRVKARLREEAAAAAAAATPPPPAPPGGAAGRRLFSVGDEVEYEIHDSRGNRTGRLLLQTEDEAINLQENLDRAREGVPVILEDQDDTLEDPSVYWKGGRELLAMPYVPYLSACDGFDSSIVLWQLMEIPFTSRDFQLKDPLGDGFVTEASPANMGDGCSLVEPNATLFIDQWAPQRGTPLADSCSLEFKCYLEEKFLEAAAVTRWFEMEGDVGFYLTTEAEEQDRLFEASILARDDTEPPVDLGPYEGAIASQSMIPVGFGPEEEGAQVAKGTVPQTVALEMQFYQYTARDKRMISAGMSFGEYTTAKKHDGSLSVSVGFEALNFFNLLNFFAFETLFYFLLFLLIGFVAVAIVVTFWIFNRIFTRLKDPPRFRFLPYLRISAPAPFVGTTLAMVPFFLGQQGINYIFTSIAFFDTIPQDLDELGRTRLDSDVQLARNGRMATAFMTLSLYMLYACSVILIPRKRKADDYIDEKDELSIWTPEAWKRSHFIVANIMAATFNIALIEFSYTELYGAQFFTCFLGMKVLHLVIEKLQINFLKEELLGTPASVGLTMTAGLVTISADDFTDFTLSFYLELIIALVEYVFLASFITWVGKQWPRIKHFMDKMYYRIRRRTISQELLAGLKEDEDSVVEELMTFLTTYGVSSAALVMTPFFIYFFYEFNGQLQLSFLFGIRQKDLLIYLLFAVVIIPFQIVMDIFIFNTQELFHGWKVYEYMKYARYRFLHRTARWKGLETQYDESIHESLRTTDQLCFSSQFYFMLGLGGSGTFLFALSVEMMLRAQYNMFRDPLFGIVIGMIIVGSVLVSRVALIIADFGGLWKIKDGGSFGDDLIQDDGELPFDDEVLKGAESTYSGDGTGGGQWSTRDLTTDAFRQEFLKHNRMWLLEQLGELLTPRTAKKLKLGGRLRVRGSLSDDDSSEDDERDFGEVNLSPPTLLFARMWLEMARRKAPGQYGRRQQLSESDSSDEDGGGKPRFGAVSMSQMSAGMMQGWLAAVRQARRTGQAPRGAAAMLSTSDDSSDSDGDRAPKFGPVRLGNNSRMLAKGWLAHVRMARARRGPRRPAAPQRDGISSGSSSDSELSGGENFKGPVALRGRLSTMLLGQWLAAMRRRRALDAQHAQRVRQIRTEVSSDSSDSDGSGKDQFDPMQQKQPVLLAPATLATLTTWLAASRAQRQMRAMQGGGGAANPPVPEGGRVMPVRTDITDSSGSDS